MDALLLSTQRLTIRPLTMSDLDDFHAYRCDPEVSKYQGFETMNREEAETFIASNINRSLGVPGQWVQYAIALKSAGKVIGDCALRLKAPDPRIAEIGITIAPEEQQKGFASEVLRGLLAFLFDQQNIHRVVETVDADNQASIQLLKSLGFRLEGHFIENIFFKGKWGSEMQFAMLKREWEKNNPQ